MTVTHLHLWMPGFFSHGTRNATLCGRARHADEFLNNTREIGEVTCKFCLRQINPPSPRYLKWKDYQPED